MIKEQKAWTINDNNKWRCNKLRRTIFIFETRLWRIENRCRINEPVQFFIAYGVLQLLIHGFCCQCIDISVSFHSFKWGTVGDIENPFLFLKLQRHHHMNSCIITFIPNMSIWWFQTNTSEIIWRQKNIIKFLVKTST